MPPVRCNVDSQRRHSREGKLLATSWRLGRRRPEKFRVNKGDGRKYRRERTDPPQAVNRSFASAARKAWSRVRMIGHSG